MTARPLSSQLALGWGAAAIFALAALPWASRFAAVLPSCPLRAATGLPCPACGSGRAILALAGGDLIAAFALQPLLVLAGGAFVIGGVAVALAALFGRPLAEPRELPAWARILAPVALLAQWLYLVASGR